MLFGLLGGFLHRGEALEVISTISHFTVFGLYLTCMTDSPA